MPPYGETPPDAIVLGALRLAAARHGLLAPGDRVLVAVSGGPDSVALLHALTRLAPELTLALHVCHVDHGLRSEAEREAAFVQDLAAGLGWPVSVERVRVAARPGRSPEAAARTARHAALDRVARAVGATRIALGHTADDQAETVLMRVLQGAGPRGLGGIPLRRGRVIRPLLEVERATVLRYLEVHGLPWVEDRTNRDTKLLRNRIRHELLPLLAAHGWSRVREALRRTARAAGETTEALDALLAPHLAGLVRPAIGGYAVPLGGLRGLPTGAVKALLRRALVEVVARPALRPGLRAGHLDRLAALVEAPVGARVRLPGGLAVERARETLWITGPTVSRAAVPLAVPGETREPGLGLCLIAEVGRAAPEVPAEPAREVWFDARALSGPPVLRPCRVGDRLVPFGSDRPVRVTRFLAQAGIPRTARGGWPLLVTSEVGEEEVLWVVGVRRGAAAPVTPETDTVLRVRVVLEPPRSPREEST